MGVSVQFISSSDSGIENIEDRIQTMAESRLRAARLFADSASHRLYVRLDVAGPAFSAYMDYTKPLHDAVSDLTYDHPTWIYFVGTGTHGGNSERVLQALSERVDQFILEYLRVNEPACK